MAATYAYTQLKTEKNPLHAEVQIGSKVLVTPFYGSIIRSNIDAECLRELASSGLLKNTQVVCYNLADAEKFRGVLQKSIFEFTGQQLSFKPFSEFVLTIDPAGEYLQYNVKSEVDKLLAIADLPQGVRDILQSEGTQRTKLLKELMNDESKIARTVEWYLTKSISYGSRTAIAPCLPIKGQATLKYALTTNRLAVTTQEANEWQKTVYYLIDFAAFKDEIIIDSIIDQIYSLAPSIVIFKIYNSKFYDGDSVTQRHNLNEFLRKLSIYRQANKALTFALNVDALGYHYIAQGLCGFIEPISGNFNPDIRVRKKSVELEEEQTKSYLGKYPHPLKLVECDESIMTSLAKNTGVSLPCHCAECSKYESLPKNKDVYNRMRRKHRVLIRDQFIDEINVAASNGTLRTSMFDRMSESSKLSPFKVNYQ